MRGNPRMNLAFCAQVFNTRPGLSITEEEAYEMAVRARPHAPAWPRSRCRQPSPLLPVQGMLDDDEGDSREERVFRMWINSLHIKDVYVHNLFEDLRDGVVLLQVMDTVQPGMVSWRRVNRVCKNKFKKVENANYVVVLGKQMKFSMCVTPVKGRPLPRAAPPPTPSLLARDPPRPRRRQGQHRRPRHRGREQEAHPGHRVAADALLHPEPPHLAVGGGQADRRRGHRARTFRRCQPTARCM